MGGPNRPPGASDGHPQMSFNDDGAAKTAAARSICFEVAISQKSVNEAGVNVCEV